MTSYSHKGLSQSDWKKIEAFKVCITHTYALGKHSESFCQKKMKELKKFGIEGKCQICGPTTDKEKQEASTLKKAEASTLEKQLYEKQKQTAAL